MIHFVLLVTFLIMSSYDEFQVVVSISTKTGFKPSLIIATTGEIIVKFDNITSLFFLI